MTKWELIGKILGKITGMFLTTWFVMLLWNFIMVGTFGLPTIGYWVAFGMRWLCHWLFNIGITVTFFDKN